MIIVFGSLNMDTIVRVKAFPEPGETILSPRYDMLPGGKGANQAIAAARAEAKVALVGRVGDDGAGVRIQNQLRRNGVLTSGVAESENLPTGMAFILTNETGENQIISCQGANLDIDEGQVPDEILKPGNMLIMQGETPAEQNWVLLKRAHEAGTTTLLNMAPVIEISPDILAFVDYLIVNEIEAAQLIRKLGLTSKPDAIDMAHTLADAGKLNCVVTMAAKGSVAVTRDGAFIHVGTITIDEVIDTTGAGDAYCGTMAAILHAGRPLEEAMRMGSVAGTLACTKRGTQDSYAYLGDIQERLEDLPPAVVKKL